MKIEKKNMDTFNTIYLHDMWLNNIDYIYTENKLVFNLNDERSNSNREFIANDVAFFHVNAVQPWGKGYYIFDIELIDSHESAQSISAAESYRNLDYNKEPRDCIGFVIIMNSGDTFTVFCKTIEYNNPDYIQRK